MSTTPMPTIIDSLMVKLGLDSKDYEKGKAKVDAGLDATAKRADKAGASVKKSAEGFEETAKSVLKFLGVIGSTYAIQHFIERTVAANAALSRFSRNLGQDTSTVSAWSQAAEQAGGSAEGLQASMRMLSMEQTRLMLTGDSQLIPFFSALGMGMAGVDQKGKDVADMFLEMADRFERLNASRTTKFNMGVMFGGIDPGTMNLLLQSRKEIEATVRKLKEHIALTKAQGEESERLSKRFIEATQSWRAFGREFVSFVTPAIEAFLSLLGRAGDWIRANSEFVKAFLVMVAVQVALIAAAFISLNPTIAIIGAVTAGVLGLTAAIALLWQDYQTWQRGGQSLIPWSKWEPELKAAAAGMRWFSEAVTGAHYRIFAAVDAASSALRGDWDAARFAFGQMMRGNEGSTGEIWQGSAGTRIPYGSAGRPGSASPGAFGGPTGGATASGRTDAAYVIAYMMARGWTREQAAGIAANILRESSFNPTAQGDYNKKTGVYEAYGLLQWQAPRQGDFKARYGKDIRDASVSEQLDFLHHELTAGKEQSAGARIRGATTAGRAAADFSRYGVRPHAADFEATMRASEAMRMFGGIPGASAAAAGVGASSPVAGSVSKSLTIGEVTVNTQATDAPGIARDLGKSMDSLFASQANQGLF